MTIRKMYNADLNATGEATEEAFNMIYVLRGWVLMEPLAATASEVVGRPVVQVSDLTVDEARRVIASVGVPQPVASASKDSVLEVMAAAVNGTYDPSATTVDVPAPQEAEVTNGARSYEPADHTASEVTDYLLSVDAAEVQRVKDLESAGKQRTTILNWESPASS